MLEAMVTLAVVLAIPVVLLVLLLKLVWWLVMLPFRLLGALFKGAAAMMAGLLALLATVIAVVLIPLVPVFLLIGMFWLVVRPRPAPRLATLT